VVAFDRDSKAKACIQVGGVSKQESDPNKEMGSGRQALL
jgi:hypothetical protein